MFSQVLATGMVGDAVRMDELLGVDLCWCVDNMGFSVNNLQYV